MPWLTPSHGPLGFHPRVSGLTGLRAPLVLVIFIDGRNSAYLSPAKECSHPVRPYFCWKVKSRGGQYGFGHLVGGH